MAPSRLAFVGIDNVAAGRTAAYLLGRFVAGRSGKVAVVAGTLIYVAHQERVAGFRAALQERFPELAIAHVMKGLDDFRTTYRLATLALKDPELIGIYSAGAGNRGIARALVRSGRADDVVFVGHEFTEHSRAFLMDGVMDAVIDQNPTVQAAQVLERLMVHHGIADHAPNHDLLPGEVVFAENLPPQPSATTE